MKYFFGEVGLLVPGLQCGVFVLGESGVLRVLEAWWAHGREVAPVMSLARCGVCGSIGREQGDAMWFLPVDQVGGGAVAGDLLTVPRAGASGSPSSSRFGESLALTLRGAAVTDPIGLSQIPSGALHTPVCGECGRDEAAITVELRVQTSLSGLVRSLTWKIEPSILVGLTQ